MFSKFGPIYPASRDDTLELRNQNLYEFDLNHNCVDFAFIEEASLHILINFKVSS
jgi:hypothetical protein